MNRTTYYCRTHGVIDKGHMSIELSDGNGRATWTSGIFCVKCAVDFLLTQVNEVEEYTELTRQERYNQEEV